MANAVLRKMALACIPMPGATVVAELEVQVGQVRLCDVQLLVLAGTGGFRLRSRKGVSLHPELRNEIKALGVAAYRKVSGGTSGPVFESQPEAEPSQPSEPGPIDIYRVPPLPRQVVITERRLFPRERERLLREAEGGQQSGLLRTISRGDGRAPD